MYYSHTQFMCVLCLHQFSMPISSSPVSTLSAWCHVVWEKTRQCILSSAPPWCTQRRLSPSRDALSSSTTLTVSSQAFLYLAPFSAKTHKLKCTYPVSFLNLILLVQLILLCSLYPSPCFTFSSLLSALFSHEHFVLPCSCFPLHLIIFLSPLIRLCSSHPHFFFILFLS